jgi:hypothetical protein
MGVASTVTNAAVSAVTSTLSEEDRVKKAVVAEGLARVSDVLTDPSKEAWIRVSDQGRAPLHNPASACQAGEVRSASTRVVWTKVAALVQAELCAECAWDDFQVRSGSGSSAEVTLLSGLTEMAGAVEDFLAKEATVDDVLTLWRNYAQTLRLNAGSARVRQVEEVSAAVMLSAGLELIREVSARQLLKRAFRGGAYAEQNSMRRAAAAWVALEEAALTDMLEDERWCLVVLSSTPSLTGMTSAVVRASEVDAELGLFLVPSLVMRMMVNEGSMRVEGDEVVTLSTRDDALVETTVTLLRDTDGPKTLREAFEIAEAL